MDKILILGDSLVMRGYEVDNRGWVAQLAAYLSGRFEVVARGCSGYTSAGFEILMQHLLRDLPEAPASEFVAVIVWLGANDSAEPGSQGEQHVPIADYEAHLAAILGSLKARFARCKARIVLTPGRCDPRVLANFNIAAHVNSTMREYAAAAASVAAAREWVAVDMHAVMAGAGAGTDAATGAPAPGVLLDGLHLDSAGNDLVYAEVRRALVAADTRFADQERFAFPYWRTLPAARSADCDADLRKKLDVFYSSQRRT